MKLIIYESMKIEQTNKCMRTVCSSESDSYYMAYYIGFLSRIGQFMHDMFVVCWTVKVRHIFVSSCRKVDSYCTICSCSIL